MSEEPNAAPESGPTSNETTNSWQEVGRQFQALGESLAQAMRASWQHEETQKRVQEMRAGLESMAHDIGKAVEDTANSPEGMKVRADAHRAAESLRTATEQTVQEVRPQLITALQQLNDELQKLINRMGQKETPPTEPPTPPSSSEPPSQNSL